MLREGIGYFLDILIFVDGLGFAGEIEGEGVYVLFVVLFWFSLEFGMVVFIAILNFLKKYFFGSG